MRPHYSIIIPAYNEESVIGHAVQETQRFFLTLPDLFEIIVVNDGSTDRTAQKVDAVATKIPELRHICLLPNRGKGAAVHAGVLAAQGDYLLFLDADLSTHPSEFLRFIPHLEEADILIGSRGLPHSHISQRQPLYRGLAGKGFNFFIRHYLHLPFRDTQCGFKVFHKRTKIIFQEQQTTGWAFDVELLARAQAHHFQVKDLPVHWKNDIHSKVRLRSFFSILAELRRIKQALTLEKDF